MGTSSGGTAGAHHSEAFGVHEIVMNAVPWRNLRIPKNGVFCIQLKTGVSLNVDRVSSHGSLSVKLLPVEHLLDFSCFKRTFELLLHV
jgi:hypothetical protein